MKKIKIFLTFILMFIGIECVSAFDTTLKVYDYAQELSSEEELYLKALANKYIENNNIDMVLVTVRHHDKEDTKVYAEDFYDYNGFGIGDDKSGILFVIDFTFGYRDIRILTTGRAINIYNDDRIDNMINDISDIQDKSYYDWFKKFVNDASYYAEKGISSDLTNEKSSPLIGIIIVSLIIPTVVVIIFIFKNKMVRKSTDANYYLKDGSVSITKRSDTFVTTNTTSIRINTPSNSGSTTSSGSSGISHGGGGARL